MRHTVSQYMFSPPPSRNGYHTSKSTPRCPLLKLNSSPAKELRLHSTDSYTQGRTAEASAHGNMHPLAMSSFCRRTLAGPFGRKEWQSRGEEGTSRSVFFSCTNVPFLSLRHCHVNRKKIPVPILMKEPVKRAQGIPRAQMLCCEEGEAQELTLPKERRPGMNPSGAWPGLPQLKPAVSAQLVRCGGY